MHVRQSWGGGGVMYKQESKLGALSVASSLHSQALISFFIENGYLSKVKTQTLSNVILANTFFLAI